MREKRLDHKSDRSSYRRIDPRQQILQAAGDVFFRKGFDRTSVDMIAAKARMSKQSIYELFPGKIALFEAAVRDALDASGQDLSSVHPTADLAETLAGYGKQFFSGFAKATVFGLFRANIVAASHFPELAAELHEHRLGMSHGMARYLETSIANGTLAAVDPISTAIRFGGMVISGARYFFGTPLPDPPARAAMIDSAIAIYLDGYRTQIREADGPLPSLLNDVKKPAMAGTAALRLSAEKVTNLIEIALSEFLEKAYTNVSVERIAASVQSSKATVYRQFGNKEKLFRYLIEDEIFASSRTDFPIEHNARPEEAMATLARQVLDWHLEPANIRVHRLLIQEADFVPDLARRFYEVRVEIVTNALDRLLTAHAMPLPNAFAAEAFYTLATYAVRFLTTRTSPGADDRDRYSRECAQIFLRGIRVHDGYAVPE